MSEEAKTPQEPERAPLSVGKRNALLRYMAILFGVAFLLVLLSFLIQMRDSRETISDLSASKTNALENALRLQEENQSLTVANGELTDQVAQLEAEAKAQAETAEAAMADLESQLTQAEDDRAAAENKHRQALSDTQAAYDLLLTAQAALAGGDRESAQNALDSLAPQRALLSPAARMQYDQIQSDLTAEEAPEGTPEQ